jgi:hypothetical protein
MTSIHRALPGRRQIAGFVLAALFASVAVAQTTVPVDRITQELTSGPVRTVAGTVHPLTKRASDVGRANPEMPMTLTLNFAMTAAQQTDLNALLQGQQTLGSPQYHQWLTQAEFGARFGLSDADLRRVSKWLAGKGFLRVGIAPSRNSITFSGKAEQVESAFGTELRQYRLNGEAHFANATEIRLPATLAAVVINVRGLNDFRPKSNFSGSVHAVSPQFTTSNGTHFMAPGDWATIYDVTSIYNAGYSGTGAHVGVVGQTYAPQIDIDNFRSAAGLSGTKINYVCISSANCTDQAGTSTDGDLLESDLDIEWAGGIAKNATVDFIYAAYGDTLDVMDALQYAIQSYKVGGAVVPVLSMSYESCEQNITSSDAESFLALAKQANTQGQTIVVASGDSGAAGCDAHDDPAETESLLGLSVGVPADVPNVTSVGGTTLIDGGDPNLYWSSSTTAVNTALQYIPESAWNDSGSDGLAASGGGVSTYFPAPAWQPAPANFTGPSGRFVPDVAFSASAHDGYLNCSQANFTLGYGSICTNGFLSSNGYLFYGSGTSAGTPSFAGLLTLLTQKYGSLGNVNPTLYGLASNATTYASIFHDITTGNNDVPCVSTAPGCVNGELGYPTETGYDLVTGLGSIDGGNLLTALGNAAKLATVSVMVTASPQQLTMGSTTTLSATVTSTQSGTPTGSITFFNGGTSLGTATVSGGTATLSSLAITPANGFTAGTTPLISADYSGDSDFQASVGSTTITLAPLPATTTTVTVNPSSVMIGSQVTLTVSVTSTVAGSINGTATFTAGSATIGSATVTNGAATLTVTTSSSIGLGIGTDTITASYSGDPINYQASKGTVILTVQSLPVTTVSVTASPSTLTARNTTTLTATVTSNASGTPTGTVTFTIASGGITLGSGNLVNGTATLSNLMVDSANWLSPGNDTVTASYGGDSHFSPSSGTVVLTVNAIPTTTTISATPATVMYNNPVTFTMTINSPLGVPPYGQMYLSDSLSGFYAIDSFPNGTATVQIVANSGSGLAVGTDTVTANLTSWGDFGASTASTQLTVTPQPATVTTIGVTPNALTIGQTTTLSATITSAAPGTPTGTVMFSNGSSGTLTNGTVTIPNVTVDVAHGFSYKYGTITATYSGDMNFASSTGSAPLTITPLPSTTTVTASPSPVTLDDPSTLITVTASGPGGYTPTGSVTLQAGGQQWVGSPNNGWASERLTRAGNCAKAYYGFDTVPGLAHDAIDASLLPALKAVPKKILPSFGLRGTRFAGSSQFTNILSAASEGAGTAAAGVNTLRIAGRFLSPIATAAAIIDVAAITTCTLLD